MNALEIMGRCTAAADEFGRHEHRGDALRVIESLCGGLTQLRDLLFARVHADVERRMGLDSLIAPVSEEKSERMVKAEIEIYEVAVAAGAAAEKGYVADGAWFRDWLMQLRMGPAEPGSRAARRLEMYAGKTCPQQRLAFGNVLAAALPEASRSPLVLLQLVPPAVKIATGLAFGKSADALLWRHQQMEILPPIGDCHLCHGGLLENGEQCSMCGNPIWNFEWLTTAG